jgi:hypothetical protein
MKATIKKYNPPQNGYVLRLGFEEITTIRMALEKKIKSDFQLRKSPMRKREIKYTLAAMRGVRERELYVD